MDTDRRMKQRTGITRTKRHRGRGGNASDPILNQVRGQVEPAFAFAVSYLRLLSEELGLGALAVWFGAEGIEEFGAGKSKEFEWQDAVSALLQSTMPLGPQGQSSFCATLRKNPEADRRCHECDAKWIARARKSGRSWAYQCHAGLSEAIAPIVVNGKRVGEIMGGQLASTDELPNGFEDVWCRLQDIQGLDRKSLAKAFSEIHVVDKVSHQRIRTHLQAAARALGALIESVADLMSREALLGQVRSYAERDFAWFALTQPDAAAEKIVSRARALGLSGMPTAAIVILADRTDRASFRQGGTRAAGTLSALFEAVRRILEDEPNSVVCSLRPEELLILLSPEQARNPSLRRLRVEEIAERLRKEMESRYAGPLLVGVSDCDAPFVSLAKAYEEAHTNMGRVALSSTVDDATLGTSVARVVSRMTQLGDAVRRAVRAADRSALDRAMEAQLRLVAGCPGDSDKACQCLFTQMVLNLLSAFRSVSEDVHRMDDVEARYALVLPSLQTASDMTEWFHVHLLPLIETILVDPSAKLDRIIAKACDLTASRLTETIGREEVAEVLGLSGTYFGKVFRAKTGMTYREFVKRLRVSKAQKLLLLPGRTVAEVAGELGYSTTAAFSRSFEKFCGASPSAYRNNPRAFPRIRLPERAEV